MAREAALGVRLEGFEAVRRGVLVELCVSPIAAVREPLAVPHHEIEVMQGVRYERRRGSLGALLRVPMDLGHLGAVGERLAVAGHAGLVGGDDLRIPEDHLDQVSALADADDLPGFVSLELGECETVRHLHTVLVLSGNGPLAQNGERHHKDDCQPEWNSRHGLPPALTELSRACYLKWTCGANAWALTGQAACARMSRSPASST